MGDSGCVLWGVGIIIELSHALAGY